MNQKNEAQILVETAIHCLQAGSFPGELAEAVAQSKSFLKNMLENMEAKNGKPKKPKK